MVDIGWMSLGDDKFVLVLHEANQFRHIIADNVETLEARVVSVLVSEFAFEQEAAQAAAGRVELPNPIPAASIIKPE